MRKYNEKAELSKYKRLSTFTIKILFIISGLLLFIYSGILIVNKSNTTFTIWEQVIVWGIYIILCIKYLLEQTNKQLKEKNQKEEFHNQFASKDKKYFFDQKIILLKDFLISYHNTFKVLKYEDFLWIYLKKVNHYYAKSIVIVDKKFNKYEIAENNLKSCNSNALINAIAEKCSIDTVIGMNEENKKYVHDKLKEKHLNFFKKAKYKIGNRPNRFVNALSILIAIAIMLLSSLIPSADSKKANTNKYENIHNIYQKNTITVFNNVFNNIDK